MQAEPSRGTATAGARATQGAAGFSVPTPDLSASTVQTTAAPAMGGNAANAVPGAGGSAALSLGTGAAARVSPELSLSDGAAGVAGVGVRVGLGLELGLGLERLQSWGA